MEAAGRGLHFLRIRTSTGPYRIHSIHLYSRTHWRNQTQVLECSWSLRSSNLRQSETLNFIAKNNPLVDNAELVKTSKYTTENQRCRLIPIGTRIARGLLFILIPEWHSNQDQEIRISSRLSTANCSFIYFGWYIHAQRTRRFSSDAHRATYITRINSKVRLRPSSRREFTAPDTSKATSSLHITQAPAE